MTGNIPQKRVFFENLDGLRFFCVLSVFLYHSFYTTSEVIKSGKIYQFVKFGLFGNGNLGVNFFFVLSGFLISYLLIEEKKLNGKINLPYFWIRRILRIWPLYFFCVVFGFVIMPWIKSLFGEHSTETADPFYYLTFLSNFDVIRNGLPDASILGVLWSVSIEEQFYLLWPLILAFTPLKRVWIWFVFVVGASVCFRALNDTYILREIHTFSCMGDLAIGALGAWLIHFAENFKLFFIKLDKWQAATLYILVVVVFFFRDNILMGSYFLRIFERPLIAILFLCVILEQSYAERSLFKLSRFTLISRLGVISYGQYCLHFIAILVVIKTTQAFAINKELWQIIFLETPFALALTIFLSIMSYRFFEGPFLKLKSKFSFITK